MKIALVGYGLEGEAAFTYWSKQGADITVCDQDVAKVIPDGIDKRLGAHYLDNLDKFDVVWRTAGINPTIILEKNPGLEPKITTTINEFLRVCPTKNVIGITGTKGKGTTSTLTAKMLEAAGKHVLLGGNIGLSPFDFLDRIAPDSWVVLELSSFQLCDLKYSPRIAVCLMVVPEHLNWHKDMDDYLHAKSQLFARQTDDDTAIYFANSDTSREIASAGAGTKIPYYAEPGAIVRDDEIVIDGQTVIKTKELKLLGEHNWQNVCAAVTTVWQVVQDIPAMHSVLASFAGLEHRLEFVRELDGVKYYDDSFGTTPETAIVAIQAFEGPKVLIVGGSDKGVAFDELAQMITHSNVRHVIVIGNTTHPEYKSSGPMVLASLQAAGVTAVTSLVKPGGVGMQEIVATAREHARPGDIVLLSTGTASFDMFQNYKDRGNQFKDQVNKLPG